MSNPSWSLNNVDFETLPGYYKIGGRPASVQESNIVHRTGNGAKFTYNMFTEEVRELIFHVLESDLDEFRALHDAVNGEQFPFYFSLSGAGVADSIQVYKEAGFDPREIERSKNGILFEYILQVRSAIL